MKTVTSRKAELQDLKLQKKVVEFKLTTDKELFERFLTRKPKDPKASGDMKYPGYDGLWGEWVATNKRWSDNRWYVSSIRGFPKTDRMTLAKAWLIRCLRMEKL